MSNVLKVVPETAKIDVNQILEEAKDQLEDVVVIGTHKDGTLYVASSTARAAEVMMYCDLAKHQMMSDVLGQYE